MGELLRGRVQAGKGDASHWLRLFNAAYSRKLQMPVYPGSLNLALEYPFDWFAARYEAHVIWFGREEYGGNVIPSGPASTSANSRSRQKAPGHSHSNVQDISYREGLSYQPTERRDSKWRNDLALSLRMDIAG